METNNNEIDVDPDYKINNTALRKIEDKDKEENKITPEKVSKIIAEEFDKELSIRQQQLEEIEDKIYKAQKLLHLVRYVLVTSYYNKKSLEYDNTGAESSVISDFDAQNRIHPAVKKLLSGNSSLEVLNCKGKRRARSKNCYGNDSSSSQLPTVKKIKLESKENSDNSFKPQVVDNNQNLQKNRKKYRYRIVVGNISKWMPSLENDNTTHKWMVYVRGVKEAVDISSIVEKVVFYLHPSYKPHDVVEISSYPFHLSRRGWGEFPIRVQIFFKCPLNKPVSIVHNLKLDKTCTGRQTLGNETVVDLYLHESEVVLQEEPEKGNCQNLEMLIQDIKQEDINLFPGTKPIKQETVVKMECDENPCEVDSNKIASSCIVDNYDAHTDLNTSSFEHDYCYDEEIVKENDVTVDVVVLPSNESSLLDHTYSLPYDEDKKSSSNRDMRKNELKVVDEQQNNKLIYGLGELYVENSTKTNDVCNKQEKVSSPIDKCVVKTFKTATGQPIKILPQGFNRLLLSNGNVIHIQLLKHPQPDLKKTGCDTQRSPQRQMISETNPIDHDKHKLSLPNNHRFKNMGEVLPYLFKRLPLWNELAGDPHFKCTYPFVASSMPEFLSWSAGKRANSEWCRAKAFKKLLASEHFPDLERWSTRTFFMYGRSHGYTPLMSSGVLYRNSEEMELLMSCFSRSIPRNKFRLEDQVNSDVIIDITADMEAANASNLPPNKNHAVDISDSSLRHHCAFVKEAALDCGIILKPEEIAEGVSMNAAERMIFEATRCFAECLIRRARHHLVCQENFSEETSEITVKEINMALNERSEVGSIVNFQKRKREMDFFL